MLHEFLSTNRAEILARARAKVAARPTPRATPEELENGIPLFLDQLIGILRSASGTSGTMGESAARHGADRDRSYVALRPELVLEVAFDQVTGGRIRHGTRPLRWRTDKAPQQCTLDQLEVAGTVLQLLEAGVTPRREG